MGDISEDAQPEIMEADVDALGDPEVDQVDHRVSELFPR